MTASADRGFDIGHPAPHRGRVGRVALFAALLGPVGAWGAQLLVNYGLASHACFPAVESLPEPLRGFDGIESFVALVNIAALVIALLTLLLAMRNWTRTRDEHAGRGASLLESGDGRTRFLSVWSICFAVLFAAAIAFNSISLLTVPLCDL